MQQIGRHYIVYLAGAIIPGALNFLSILYFKSILGDALFAAYNLLFTFAVIFYTCIIAWVSQAVLRFGAIKYKESGIQEAVLLTLLVSTVASLIALPFFYTFDVPIFRSLLFCLMVVGTTIHLVLMAYLQSKFDSVACALGELIRVMVFLGSAAFFLSVTSIALAIEKLQVSWVLSTIVVIAYLGLKADLFRKPLLSVSRQQLRLAAKTFYAYSGYLIYWYLMFYIMTYLDRYVIYAYLSAETAGRYAALFDLILKGMGLMAAPVMAIYFPTLVQREQLSAPHSSISLTQSALKWGVLILICITLLYYFVGFRWMHVLLHINEVTTDYRLTGVAIVLASGLWQLSLIVQKQLELQGKTGRLLLYISISMLFIVMLSPVLIKQLGVKGAAFSYLLANLIYFVLMTIQLRQQCERLERI